MIKDKDKKRRLSKDMSKGKVNFCRHSTVQEGSKLGIKWGHLAIRLQSGRSSQQCNINFGSDKGERLRLRDEEVEEEGRELGKWLLDTKEVMKMRK